MRQEIEAWRVGRAPPFIFTELGYRSRAGATAAPWDEGPGGKPDPDEQRRGFAAFRRVWTGAPILDGVYIWNWYGYGGPGTTSYTPRGKPAEAEVRALLGRDSRRASSRESTRLAASSAADHAAGDRARRSR